MSDLKPVPKGLLAAGVLFAGICSYFSFSLSAHIWWLLWIAPVPILYFSLRLSRKWAFILAFAAYLIGRLSWVPYLLSIMPLPLVVTFTLLYPLIFALQVTAARKLMLSYAHWSTVFVFPVLFTTIEYLSFIYSPDGTAGSVAYTQCDFLPVVQLASLTGIEGISFLVTFIPTAIALLLYRYQQKQSVRTLVLVTIGILGATMVWGIIRLNQTTTAPSLKVGLASIDKEAYHKRDIKGEDKDLFLATLYLSQVRELAKQGAEMVVFPEKMFTISNNRRPGFLQQFKDTAIANHVKIVACMSLQNGAYYENRAWVIGEDGTLLEDYQKVHLFPGELLDSVKPGKFPGLFLSDTITEGVAICKDMDFQQYINKYGKAGCNVLYVPAWDFQRDGWLHSRMAIMRCVEGGYGMVRNARMGRLTVNDYCGRVLYEANSDNGIPMTLTGSLDIQHHPTLYNKWGDWFSILNAIASLVCLLLLVKVWRH